jgi:hypothetical protein
MKFLMDLAAIIIQIKAIMKELLCRVCPMDLVDLLMEMEIIMKVKYDMEEQMATEFIKIKMLAIEENSKIIKNTEKAFRKAINLFLKAHFLTIKRFKVFLNMRIQHIKELF